MHKALLTLGTEGMGRGLHPNLSFVLTFILVILKIWELRGVIVGFIS